MSFTLAIVGRPNVGKSTLFNRLTGKKTAIVHNQPGVTRDRKRANANLGPLSFSILDTAGLEKYGRAQKDTMEQKMMDQTEAAIDEADVILFLIDGKEGVTAADLHFAKWLRKKDTPVTLVVNKCEGRDSDEGFAEAYRLGFNEPVAISAEHGMGMTEMYEALETHAAKFAIEDEPDEEGAVVKEDQRSIAIIGRPNAGKSTLLNQLLGEERSITGPEAGITRDAIYTEWEYKGTPIQLVDTAGLRKKAKVVEAVEKLSTGDSMRAVRYANLVVLLLDGTLGIEKQDLTLADHVIEEGRGLVIAINKWDAVKDKKETLEEIEHTLEHSLTQARGVPVVRISALNGDNVYTIIDMCLDIFARWNTRLTTAKLNRWLDGAVSQHLPPLVRGRRLKIKYIMQRKGRPPTFYLFTNHIKEFPNSYLRYLSQSLRKEFDLEGVPIRIRLKKSDNPYAEKVK
jgi:GTP-binding protein